MAAICNIIRTQRVAQAARAAQQGEEREGSAVQRSRAQAAQRSADSRRATKQCRTWGGRQEHPVHSSPALLPASACLRCTQPTQSRAAARQAAVRRTLDTMLGRGNEGGRAASPGAPGARSRPCCRPSRQTSRPCAQTGPGGSGGGAGAGARFSVSPLASYPVPHSANAWMPHATPKPGRARYAR